MKITFEQTEGNMAMGETRQLSFEAHRLESEIIARGYAEFEHGISEDEIAYLIERYAAFTLNHPDPKPETMNAMLPPTSPDLHKQLDDLDRSKDRQQDWHKYRTNTRGVGKPDGYTNRSFQTGALGTTRGVILEDDPKEFYHYTPRHHASMAANHTDYEWGPIPPEVIALEHAFAPIHKKAGELLIKVMGLIEETHPEARSMFNPESIHTSPVRLLFYHPSEGSQLGAAHYDKSFFTEQLAESHQGLRVAPDADAELQPVVRNSNLAVVFPSYSFAQSLSEDTIFQPGWHDIVRSSELNDGRSVPESAVQVCARWALIFFANRADFVNPDKAKMHSRS